MTGDSTSGPAAPPLSGANGEPSYHDLFGKAPPPRELFAGAVQPIDDFQAQPISLPRPPAGDQVAYTDANVRAGLDGWQDRVNQEGRDSHGQPFVSSTINHSLDAQAKVDEERKARLRGRHTERVQIKAEDAFKIGDPASGWVEPTTSTRDYSLARPPFARLLDAAYDFFDTRGPALLFNKKDRHYWNQMRWAMGVKAEFPGLHWPGTGPGAQSYSMQSRARRDSTREIMAAYLAGEIGEICPLLKHTERAVRGFLACARREAEAVWDLDSAIRLAEIFAAFLAFVVHHRALPDAHIAPGLQRALKLAQTGPRKLHESKAWEARIDDGKALNIAGFSLLCGNYYTRLKGITAGLAWELPAEPAEGAEAGAGSASADADAEEDDGGWGPDPNAAKVNQVDEPTPREAVALLAPVLAPVPVEAVKLWNFIPFDRRRVTAVFAPDAPRAGAPGFMARYHRFRTVSAPWSAEEGWKGRAPHKAAGDSTLDGNEHVSPGGLPFEQERDTCPIPAELDVWVDCSGIADFDPECVLGMGLRARWAQIGTEDEKWWIFKLKDYVLPSFWKSTEADLAAVAADPAPPYGTHMAKHMLPPDLRKRDEEEREQRGWGEGAGKRGRGGRGGQRAEQREAPDSKSSQPDKPSPSAEAGACELDSSPDKAADKPSAKVEEGSEASRTAAGAAPAAGGAAGPSPSPIPAPAGARNANKPDAKKAPGAAEPSPAADLPTQPSPSEEGPRGRETDKGALDPNANPNEQQNDEEKEDAEEEEQARAAAALMASYTRSLPRAKPPPAPRVSIKAVEVGKSDPDYFATNQNSYAAYHPLDHDDDETGLGEDGVGEEEEYYSEDDLLGNVPEGEGYATSDEDEDAGALEAAHWERVLKKA